MATTPSGGAGGSEAKGASDVQAFEQLMAALNTSSEAVTTDDVPSSLEQKLQAVMNAHTLPAVKAMAGDVIYVSRQHSRTTSISKDYGLVRTFVQLYQEMLKTAEQAYIELRRMQKAYEGGNIELAEELFSSAKSDCVRVGSVVQHLIECKFDASEFKCTSERCNQAAHTSAHIGPVKTCVAPRDVPVVFENKGWNEMMPFQHRLFEGQSPGMRSHLDYVFARAGSLEKNFHLHMQGVTHGVGIYHAGPLKTKSRCISQLSTYAHMQQPTSMHIKDMLRGSIVCHDVDHLRTVLERLSGSITSVKDRLQSPVHDVLTNVVFEGMVCEVQFHLHDFYRLKAFSRGPSEVTRATGCKDLLDERGALTLRPFELEEDEDGPMPRLEDSKVVAEVEGTVHGRAVISNPGEERNVIVHLPSTTRSSVILDLFVLANGTQSLVRHTFMNVDSLPQLCALGADRLGAPSFAEIYRWDGTLVTLNSIKTHDLLVFARWGEKFIAPKLKDFLSTQAWESFESQGITSFADLNLLISEDLQELLALISDPEESERVQYFLRPMISEVEPWFLKPTQPIFPQFSDDKIAQISNLWYEVDEPPSDLQVPLFFLEPSQPIEDEIKLQNAQNALFKLGTHLTAGLEVDLGNLKLLTHEVAGQLEQACQQRVRGTESAQIYQVLSPPSALSPRPSPLSSPPHFAPTSH